MCVYYSRLCTLGMGLHGLARDWLRFRSICNSKFVWNSYMFFVCKSFCFRSYITGHWAVIPILVWKVHEVVYDTTSSILGSLRVRILFSNPNQQQQTFGSEHSTLLNAQHRCWKPKPPDLDDPWEWFVLVELVVEPWNHNGWLGRTISSAWLMKWHFWEPSLQSHGRQLRHRNGTGWIYDDSRSSPCDLGWVTASTGRSWWAEVANWSVVNYVKQWSLIYYYAINEYI